MENEFRTTFIPKTPIVPQSAPSQAAVSKPVGIVFVISLIIFIVSIGIGGGVYAYKTYLQKQVEELSVSLERVQKNLDPNVIKEFTVMDKRLRNAETLLTNHSVTFPLFDVLRSTTLPTVRFTRMDLTFTDTGALAVNLSGESDGYRSIALQSQALAENANLVDTIFSNFVVTPKGRVSFDVSFTVPKSDLAFGKNIAGTNSMQESGLGANEMSSTDESVIEDSGVFAEEVVTESDPQGGVVTQ